MGSTAEKAEKKETEELQGGYSVYTDLLITTFFKCTHTDTLSHLFFHPAMVCVCVCAGGLWHLFKLKSEAESERWIGECED